MNKFIKKYIYLILVFISIFMIFPANAMKTVKTQMVIKSYEQLVLPNDQHLSRRSSLPSIPTQTNITPHNPIIERRYGTQRNRLIKECLHDIIVAIKSLFQKQTNIDISVTT